MSTPSWLRQRERGSAWLMRIMTVVALRRGRAAARLLLYPICAYFLLFSQGARIASQRYLERVRGNRVGWKSVFAHYHRFAETILDRVSILAGRDSHLAYDVKGVDELQAALDEGHGCLLFGAHFGSFEVLRSLGATHSPARVRVLMHEANASKLNATLRAVNGTPSRDIIALGRPETMLEVRDAVRAGEIVGLLADRAVADDRRVMCEFLEGSAPFPQGPFVLASLLRTPIVLFSAICDGNGKYRVRFERFDTGDDRTPAGIASQVQRYASWLERKCRADPYNWFNFYDFFATVERA